MIKLWNRILSFHQRISVSSRLLPTTPNTSLTIWVTTMSTVIPPYLITLQEFLRTGFAILCEFVIGGRLLVQFLYRICSLLSVAVQVRRGRWNKKYKLNLLYRYFASSARRGILSDVWLRWNSCNLFYLYPKDVVTSWGMVPATSEINNEIRSSFQGYRV